MDVEYANSLEACRVRVDLPQHSPHSLKSVTWIQRQASGTHDVSQLNYTVTITTTNIITTTTNIITTTTNIITTPSNNK